MKCGIPVLPEEEQKKENKIYIGKIVRIVSVIGQYGIAIPFDIVYRMLSGEISYLVGRLLETIDFLHVDIDTLGNINIFPRNSLEAQIIANSSVVSLEEKLSIVMDVINNVTEKELAFLVALLKAIGPNGNNSTYKEYYFDIANTVKSLRINEGIYNESTILQESSYIREYFKNNTEESIDVSLLIEAQNVLIDEIEKIEGKENDYRIKTTYGQMLIELSSNFGAELYYHCKNKDNKLIIETYNKFEKYFPKALIYSPDPYYPVDIFAWMAIYMLQADIPEDNKSEIYSDLSALFERVQTENPDVIDRIDYNHRLVKMESIERFARLSEEAFYRLLDMGSDAGIYLKAKSIVKDIDLSQGVDDKDVEVLEEAIAFLERDQYRTIVEKSEKCLYFLFKLYWLSIAKEPIFKKEKKILPFSKNQWERIYRILLRISDISEDISVKTNYLLGITEFHLGMERECMRRFSEIRNNYYLGAIRPILYVIVADPKGIGLAREYEGQFIKQDRERAEFYIPSIRKNLYYYNRDFVSKSHDSNEQFDCIHIGFSFMGPRIADIR